jgi:hypothetical protein
LLACALFDGVSSSNVRFSGEDFHSHVRKAPFADFLVVQNFQNASVQDPQKTAAFLASSNAPQANLCTTDFAHLGVLY